MMGRRAVTTKHRENWGLNSTSAECGGGIDSNFWPEYLPMVSTVEGKDRKEGRKKERKQ